MLADNIPLVAGGGVVSAIGMLIGGVIYARRLVSGESKVVATDKAETKFTTELATRVNILQDQIDKVTKERNDSMLEIGSLRAEVAWLRAERERWTKRNMALERRLGLNLSTDNVPLGPPEYPQSADKRL